MRVLIAVDGSEGSFEAIEQVAPLLHPDRDQLALYCRPPQVRTRGSQIDEAGAAARGVLAEAIFAEADKHLPAGFADGRSMLVGEHDPRQDIVAAAENWSADLIALGARGLSVFERLLLGSVSRAVVHTAKVPVWIARPRPKSTTTARRVLLTSERAHLARAQAEFVSKFAWPAGTAFSLLAVCTSMAVGRMPEWLKHQTRSPEVESMIQHWVREHDDEIKRQLDGLQAVVNALPEPLRSAQTVVTEGDPASEILDAATQQHCDLIVVGVHHKHSIATTIFGSTSEAVINHATASVLAVPHVAGA